MAIADLQANELNFPGQCLMWILYNCFLEYSYNYISQFFDS